MRPLAVLMPYRLNLSYRNFDCCRSVELCAFATSALLLLPNLTLRSKLPNFYLPSTFTPRTVVVTSRSISDRPRRGLTHDDYYTVACICPVGVFLAPVKAMLDEMHQSLPTKSGQEQTAFKDHPTNQVISWNLYLFAVNTTV